MCKSSRHRLFGAFIALIGMVFMQLAVAGYLCPNTNQGPDEVAMVMTPDMPDMPDMPGCDKLDPVQPSLCHVQAHANHQSLDKPPLPDVQPFVPGALALVVKSIEPAYHSPVRPQFGSLLTHATAPPLSIQNCCFRI
jgi:hypothetical protein